MKFSSLTSGAGGESLPFPSVVFWVLLFGKIIQCTARNVSWILSVRRACSGNWWSDTSGSSGKYRGASAKAFGPTYESPVPLILRKEHKRLGARVAHSGAERMARSGRETQAISARSGGKRNIPFRRKMLGS